MNKSILNTDIQYFIKKNINTDISSLLLKKPNFSNTTQQEIVEQIEAKKRCKKKLPTWFNTEGIYYPNKLNIEQTSSEPTAQYKANLVSGKSLIDLTGGFGVDSFYFSKKVAQVTHCEINNKLSEIAQHNFQKLNCSNCTTAPIDGLQYLSNTAVKFDWIYIDPSRRNDMKGKVFLLKDCLPNVPENLMLLFKKSNNILIKTSPLLDITNGLRELQFVSEVHVIALNNEVKELLFVLKKDFLGIPKTKTVNIKKNTTESFEFTHGKPIEIKYSLPQKYLFEPNGAILKSGGFFEVAKQFNISKLHQHSHLYTSLTKLAQFPGRSFKIHEILPYHKKNLKKRFKNQQVNVTTRNFPKTVASIRTELQLKDGGDTYFFFTTDINFNKILLICTKA